MCTEGLKVLQDEIKYFSLNSCTSGIKNSESGCFLVCFLRSCNGLHPTEHPIAASTDLWERHWCQKGMKDKISVAEENSQSLTRGSSCSWTGSSPAENGFCAKGSYHIVSSGSHRLLPELSFRKQLSQAFIWNKNELWFTILSNYLEYFTFQPQISKLSKEEVAFS